MKDGDEKSDLRFSLLGRCRFVTHMQGPSLGDRKTEGGLVVVVYSHAL